jgi:hypothetical protein
MAILMSAANKREELDIPDFKRCSTQLTQCLLACSYLANSQRVLPSRQQGTFWSVNIVQIDQVGATLFGNPLATAIDDPAARQAPRIKQLQATSSVGPKALLF